MGGFGGGCDRMKAILELPPSLTLDQFQQLYNDRLRDLNAALVDVVETPSERDVDLGTHRVVNVADPKDDLDAVNLRTLKRANQPAAQESKATSQTVSIVTDDNGVTEEGATVTY